MCGGTHTWHSTLVVPTGLSPRVRGNRRTTTRSRRWVRSIPACAGEPGPGMRHSSPRRVYPRVCGGTQIGFHRLAYPEGLSPRVRGNLDAADGTIGCGRSIPACAGEPVGGISKSTAAWVYPRVCGGTWYQFIAQSRNAGLSPRVRGNLVSGVPQPAPRRSIPACAGEPPLGVAADIVPAVYPRVCGGTFAT